MEFSATVILAGLILALLWLFSVKRRKYRLPPGPPGFFILLNCSFSETYGPVMTLYMGWQRTVVLVGYDAVKDALVDQADDFTGRMPVPFLFKATNGYGLVISNGKRWSQLRRFTLTTLRDFGMGRKGMEEWIQEVSQHLRVHIRTFKGKPFDPQFVLSSTISNVICCLFFGERFSFEDKQFLHLLTIMPKVTRFNSSPLGQVTVLFFPGRCTTSFPGSWTIFLARDFIKREIQEHKETLDPSSHRGYTDCFLIRINQEKDNPSSEFNYDNLVSTVLNLFVAGTETTSYTLSSHCAD
uniref:Uncharacterized protein n=1 Tax=Astatotilapia calliptera TaxID=8154 RepID=A0A3P8QIW1_ASTCA